MRSINKVILIGNLTRDPELKQTQSGQPLATFGLATNRNWTNSGGQRQTSTEFHELVAWARLAEFAAQNLRKGKLVYLEGYLKTRSWETEDGTRRFKTEIIVQDLIILSKRDGEGSASNNSSALGEDIIADMEIGGAVEDKPAAKSPAPATPAPATPAAAPAPSESIGGSDNDDGESIIDKELF